METQNVAWFPFLYINWVGTSYSVSINYRIIGRLYHIRTQWLNHTPPFYTNIYSPSSVFSISRKDRSITLFLNCPLTNFVNSSMIFFSRCISLLYEELFCLLPSALGIITQLMKLLFSSILFLPIDLKSVNNQID